MVVENKSVWKQDKIIVVLPYRVYNHHAIILRRLYRRYSVACLVVVKGWRYDRLGVEL